MFVGCKCDARECALACATVEHGKSSNNGIGGLQRLRNRCFEVVVEGLTEKSRMLDAGILDGCGDQLTPDLPVSIRLLLRRALSIAPDVAPRAVRKLKRLLAVDGNPSAVIYRLPRLAINGLVEVNAVTKLIANERADLLPELRSVHCWLHGARGNA